MRSMLITSLVVVAAASLVACSGKQKTEETTTPPADTGPSVAACGSWVVVAEKPSVTAGGFSEDALLRALLDGMGAAGCTGHTAAPASIPAGLTVLTVSLKASAIGEAGSLSAIATDTGSGDIKGRYQEKVAAGADGTAAAKTIGGKIAAMTGS